MSWDDLTEIVDTLTPSGSCYYCWFDGNLFLVKRPNDTASLYAGMRRGVNAYNWIRSRSPLHHPPTFKETIENIRKER